MAHLAKYTITQCGQLFSHTERAREAGAYGNDKIDPNKTHLNASFSDKKGMEQLQTRLNEVSHLKRKDLNVVCSWAITLPLSLKNSSINAQNAFFLHANNFLEQRYGKENKICSKAHFDETTPHLHYAFCPVTQGKKGLRISAKDVVNRHDLQVFHTELDRYIKEQVPEYKGDLLNEATREGNKSIMELKRGTATQELELLKQEQKELLAKPFQDKEIKVKTPLFSKEKQVTLSAENYNILVANYNENKQTKTKNESLKKENEKLYRDKNRLAVEKEQEIIKSKALEQENSKLQKIVAVVSKFISFHKLEQSYQKFIDSISKPKEQKIEPKKAKSNDLER